MSLKLVSRLFEFLFLSWLKRKHLSYCAISHWFWQCNTVLRPCQYFWTLAPIHMLSTMSMGLKQLNHSIQLLKTSVSIKSIRLLKIRQHH